MLKVKRFLLILPMLVCLFGISNNQQEVNAANTINAANTTKAINATNLTSRNINIEEPVNKDEIENNRWTDLDIDCEEVEALFIPPIFGFCGFSIAFGSDCGEDGNYSCFAAIQACGGGITIHSECALQ